MSTSNQPHDAPTTLRRQVWFQQIGQSKIATSQDPTRADERPAPRVTRLAMLMALVIRYEQLLRAGHIRDYAELGRLGEVTQTRITQIMNLRLLAPDIQEEILFLPMTESPVDPVSERQMRPILVESNWEKQRVLWKKLIGAK